MSTLLYLTGQIDNPFFLNEIEDFTNRFERVFVIAYGENKDSRYVEIAEQYGFEYELLSTYPSLSELASVFKQLLCDDDVKEELKIAKSGGGFLKKLPYICLYLINKTKTVKCLKRHAFDFDLNAYSFWMSRAGYSSAWLAKNHMVKRAVSRAHGYDLYESRNSLSYLPFRKFTAENLDEVAFISNNGLRYFDDKCQKCNYKHNEFKVIHLGSHYPPKIGRKERDLDKLIIVSCSSIIYLKRLDLIIRVIEGLRLAGYDAEWIHFGDGELRNSIEKMACDRLGSGFIFKGNVSNSRLLSFYANEQIDFFINMSDSEGIPVSIMEAISVGIPSIARNVGGNSEIVFAKTGILLDSNDEQTMIDTCVDSIIRIHSDRKTYEELSVGAKLHWEANFNVKINNNILIDDICV